MQFEFQTLTLSSRHLLSLFVKSENGIQWVSLKIYYHIYNDFNKIKIISSKKTELYEKYKYLYFIICIIR